MAYHPSALPSLQLLHTCAYRLSKVLTSLFECSIPLPPCNPLLANPEIITIIYLMGMTHRSISYHTANKEPFHTACPRDDWILMCMCLLPDLTHQAGLWGPGCKWVPGRNFWAWCARQGHDWWAAGAVVVAVMCRSRLQGTGITTAIETSHALILVQFTVTCVMCTVPPEHQSCSF